jgi:hypothetical protein
MSLLKIIYIVLQFSLKCIFIFALHMLKIALQPLKKSINKLLC